MKEIKLPTKYLSSYTHYNHCFSTLTIPTFEPVLTSITTLSQYLRCCTLIPGLETEIGVYWQRGNCHRERIGLSKPSLSLFTSWALSGAEEFKPNTFCVFFAVPVDLVENGLCDPLEIGKEACRSRGADPSDRAPKCGRSGVSR